MASVRLKDICKVYPNGLEAVKNFNMEIEDKELLKIVCSGFFLSRCLCGISAVSFPLAKREGTLFLFADSSHKKLVKAFLYLQSMVE